MTEFSPALLRAAALRSLGAKSPIQDVLNRLGFVQADPIRAPARAQDLTLMQRVKGYRAGDLERLYPQLDAEEDMIPNYGFVPRHVQALLHPREVGPTRIEREHPQILDEVRALLEGRPEVHPKELTALLGRGRVGNAWGGQSSASTRALDTLHYRGEARVTRREKGVRLYARAPHLQALRDHPLPEAKRLSRTIHLLAELYGPLPEASLGYLTSLSRFGFPHLHTQLRAAFRQAVREELHSARVDGVRYVWPAEWTLPDAPTPRGVRLIGPFDPLVWDRRRFAHLHGWTYRFEAYTPAPKRTLGYYALPVFQAEKAVGWANLRVEKGELLAEVQLIPGVRRTAAFEKALNAELERYRAFLAPVQGS
ncbi:DNA glycosylase AlkZ-like family protein [Deinococcus fonticola]|uniref:DNA glycosylase AlkZ-like family protein n=1 Tax=Deinococcus fonticola TaxID=2528713 RepID=UPI00107510A8|nr:crosslink repair DNA glycosylase YcaQ family protein [Deinococcus fonticola]